MKKFFTSALLFGGAQALFAQTPNDFVSSTPSSPAGEIALTVLIGLVILAAIGHMIYELFIAKKPAVLNLTACQEARKNAGLNPMTDSEAQALLDKMAADANSWTPFVNSDGEDDTIITKYSQAKQTRQVLKEVAAAMPDDSDVIDCYNSLAEVYTECTKRKYNASTTYIIISAILMVGLAIMSGAYEAIAYCGVSVLLYIMASMTPNYILIRKELKGSRGPKFMSGFIAGILTGVATAETVTTVTKWSDGSTTKDVDNSNFWISLVFSIILFVVLALFMFVLAIVNYLRNYVFHF
jgi:hypothetical protein